jgi:hypothetical protein
MADNACHVIIINVDRRVLSYLASYDVASIIHQILGEGRVDEAGTGLHSSTFRLIISAFRGMRWVIHGFIVTKMDQVELRSGRE